jgi:hypothetical protein
MIRYRFDGELWRWEQVDDRGRVIESGLAVELEDAIEEARTLTRKSVTIGEVAADILGEVKRKMGR